MTTKYKILSSHASETLSSELAKANNEGWQLSGFSTAVVGNSLQYCALVTKHENNPKVPHALSEELEELGVKQNQKTTRPEENTGQ